MFRNIRNFVIVFAAISMFAILVFSNMINSSSWKTLVESYETKRNQQAQTFMDDQMEDLKSYMYIHSNWTELQENLMLGNHEWLKENATGYMVEDPSFNVDFLYASTEGHMVEEVYGVDCIDEVRKTDLLWRSIVNNEMGTGLIKTEKGIMILVASPIFDSRGENPSGAYILGRLLDKEVLQSFRDALGSAEVTEVSITMEPEYPVVETNSYENLRMSKEILVGENALYVNMEFNIPVYRYLFVYTQHFNYFIIILAISVFAFMLLLAIKRIERYTNKTMRAVDGISKGDYSKKMTVRSSRVFPEIVKLAKAVNRMSDDLEKQSETIHRNYREMVELVVKGVEMNDTYTYRHNISVAEYAVAIGREMGFEAIDELETSAKFHDVGKISIPTQILNKPGKLTEEEYETVMNHPVNGFNMIAKVKEFDRIALGVRHHHERWDGAGYPDGLNGEEIPLMARIIAVADNYDALTSDRVYRKAMSSEKAIEIIKENSGKMFAPDVVEAFLRVIGDEVEEGQIA